MHQTLSHSIRFGKPCQLAGPGLATEKLVDVVLITVLRMFGDGWVATLPPCIAPIPFTSNVVWRRPVMRLFKWVPLHSIQIAWEWQRVQMEIETRAISFIGDGDDG